MNTEELIKKQLSKKKTACTVGGAVLLVFGALLAVLTAAGFEEDEPEPSIILAVTCLVLVVIGAVVLRRSSVYKGGLESQYLKDHPAVLQYAGELLTRPAYQDKFVTISQNAFMPKTNILDAVKNEDVLNAFQRNTYTNGVPTSSTIIVRLRNGKELTINVTGRAKETKIGVLEAIAQYCPNARIGFSPENNAYWRDNIVKK